MSASPPYIFISYASADREQVLPIVQALEGAGVRAWLDQAAIPGGTVYGPEIVDGIEGCVAFVILCSALSLASPNVRQEIALAWKYRKPYLPLLLEPVTIPRDVEYWLEGAQWVEVLDKPEGIWLPSVMQALTRLAPELVSAPKPPSAPAAPEPVKVDEPAVDVARPQLPPLVGREAELAVLRSLLEFAGVGHGQVVFLVGEPGIGKTRLTSELVAQALATGWRACWSYCHEWEGAPPYWPWIELLRAALDDLDSAALRTVLGAGGADLAQIIPELRQRLPDLPVLPPMEPEQARFRLFESVVGVLKSLARNQRLILVLDDLHWADAASVALLQFVVKPLRTLPLAIVGTYRNVEVSQQRPLAAALAAVLREPHATRLLLHGLTEDEAARYVRELTGGAPSAPTLAAIYRETEGNPFFVGEITRLLLDEGTLWQRDVGALRIRVPESVREVIGRRLERLSDDCHAMLRTASVVGRDFSLALLATLGTDGTDVLLDQLDEAVAAQLVETGDGFGSYRFSHALVQETLYEELGTARRAHLHARVGAALEDEYGIAVEAHLDELAHHFFQAAHAGSVDEAVGYARRAGERASAQLAWESAVAHYQRALQALELKRPPDEVMRCELLLALGAACWRVGDISAGQLAYQQAATLARQLNASELLARAALGFAGTDVVGQLIVGVETIQFLEEALLALGGDDSMLRSKLLAHLGVILEDASGEGFAWLERRRSLTGEAVEIARRLADTPTLLYVLILRWHGLSGVDTVTQRRAVAEELIWRAEAYGDRYMAMFGHGAYAVDWLDQGDIPAFERELAVFGDLATGTHLPIWTANVLSYRAMLAMLKGDFGEVEPLIAAWQDLKGGVSPGIGMEDPIQHLFLLRREQGRLAELEETVRQIIGMNPREDPHWRGQEALMALELGQTDRARTLFEHLIARNMAAPRDWWWLANVAHLGELCALLGDVDRAEHLYDLLYPYSDRHVSVGNRRRCFGAASYYLGLLATTLGRWGAAKQHFAHALAMHERMGARPFAARTRYAWADMLTRDGQPSDRERALDLLDQALAAAEEIGMRRLAEQVVALQINLSELRTTR